MRPDTFPSADRATPGPGIEDRAGIAALTLLIGALFLRALWRRLRAGA